MSFFDYGVHFCSQITKRKWVLDSIHVWRRKNKSEQLWFSVEIISTSKKMNLMKMSNNSHAAHLRFLATSEILFLQFTINNKDSFAGTLQYKVILHSYLYVLKTNIYMGLKLRTQNLILNTKQQ